MKSHLRMTVRSTLSEADLIARMDWLIGAAPGLGLGEQGPGMGAQRTRFAQSTPGVPRREQVDDDDLVGCDGCMCPLGHPPCHHCVEHCDEDGETYLCDA